ncbi:MAG: DUF5985 family protein [Candidatus Thermoplasmatota archaeon]|jgi:hypothetical protein
MHPSQAVVTAFIVAVHFISLILTVLAFAGWRRTGNRRLLFVGSAFLLFAIKSLLTAYSITTEFLHHEDLEAIGSMFDLAVVSLLVAPFLIRSNAAKA